jgi:hypothetical protein
VVVRDRRAKRADSRTDAGAAPEGSAGTEDPSA